MDTNKTITKSFVTTKVVKVLNVTTTTTTTTIVTTTATIYDWHVKCRLCKEYLNEDEEESKTCFKCAMLIDLRHYCKFELFCMRKKFCPPGFKVNSNVKNLVTFVKKHITEHDLITGCWCIRSLENVNPNLENIDKYQIRILARYLPIDCRSALEDASVTEAERIAIVLKNIPVEDLMNKCFCKNKFDRKVFRERYMYPESHMKCIFPGKHGFRWK